MTGQKTNKGDKGVTSDKFSTQIVAMMQTLYRVSYAQLSQSCDRDEAVQECLYKAWQKRHQLKDEQYMQTWVIRILINECHNIQRKRCKELPLDVNGKIKLPGFGKENAPPIHKLPVVD